MKNLSRSPFLLLCLVLGFPTGAVIGQEEEESQSREAKIEIKGVKVEAQKTPDFSVSNTSPKKWKAKSWLEMETVFEGKLRDRKAEFIETLTFNYFLILKGGGRDERRTLTGEIVYVNIPIGEKVAAVAYVSPSSLLKVTGKKAFSSGDVSFWGLDIYYGGKSVGWESSNNKKWWDSEKAPPKVSGMVLNKKQTPFAPLWGDFHVDVSSK